MADVSSATKFWPTAKEGFTTATSGSVSSGAATVGLNSVTGYSNGDVVCLVIDPTDTSKKQVFTGTVDTSGLQITGVVWTEGTNQAHSSGATVVDYETASAWALQAKGFLVEHSQDGTHRTDTTVVTKTATQTLTNKTLTSPTISGTITGQVIGATNLTTSAIQLGYASRTSDFVTNSNSTYVDVTGLTTTVTIPAGGRSIKITAQLPVINAAAGTPPSVRCAIVEGSTVLAGDSDKALAAANVASFFAPTIAVLTPSAGSHTYKVQIRCNQNANVTAVASSTDPAFILVEAI